MLFEAAEAKITDLETRLAALEEDTGVDLTPITTEIDALKAELVAVKQNQQSLAAELARLDARLDKIAAGAAD